MQIFRWISCSLACRLLSGTYSFYKTIEVIGMLLVNMKDLNPFHVFETATRTSVVSIVFLMVCLYSVASYLFSSVPLQSVQHKKNKNTAVEGMCGVGRITHALALS